MSSLKLRARRRLLGKIRGRGLEIGAYHSPLPVPNAEAVSYVDLLSAEEARGFYPESDNDAAVEPDVIAPADDLAVFESDSLDFLLASHVLEHLPDPLGTLEEWRRVVRPGGAIFVALPDARHSFDRARSRTTLDHLILDRDQGAEHPERVARDLGHCRDWARWVNHLDDERQITLWAELLHAARYPIHFHCWIADDFREILGLVARERGGLEILDEAEEEGCGEFAFLLGVGADG